MKKESIIGETRCPVQLQNAKVCLDIDITQEQIQGIVELRLVVIAKRIKKIRLQASQLIVQEVLFDQLPTQYEQLHIQSPCDPNGSTRDVIYKFFL